MPWLHERIHGEASVPIYILALALSRIPSAKVYSRQYIRMMNGDMGHAENWLNSPSSPVTCNNRQSRNYSQEWFPDEVAYREISRRDSN